MQFSVGKATRGTDMLYNAVSLISLISLFILGPAFGRALLLAIDKRQSWFAIQATRCAWPVHNGRLGDIDWHLRSCLEAQSQIGGVVRLDG